MVAYLTKSDASKGFIQIIDFLNGSYIKYALTVNPNIYVSCIKQFWNTVAIKQVNHVTRLQALVDKKKVVVTEAAIREVLHFDDAEGVDCLSNEEIFTELARMGYEKRSTKLTFYKDFFLSQWKFLIHTILQCIRAKRTSWNEFSSSMAYAIICLSICRKFNFSKYIFYSLVRNVDSTTKFYMYPYFLQLLIRKQLGDLLTHTTKYASPTLTQKRLRKNEMLINMLKKLLLVMMLMELIVLLMEKFLLLLKNYSYHLLPQLFHHHNHLKIFLQHLRRVEHLEYDKVAQDLEITKLKRRVKKLEKGNKARVLKLKGRMIDEMDKDDVVVLMDEKEEDKKVEEAKVVENEVQEVVDVITTAKLIIKVVTAASATIPTVEPKEPAATFTAAPARVVAAPSRRRKGVIIRDPKEELATSEIIPAETKSKDKGKGILVEEPKPLKKKQQIAMDEEYARKLHVELNKNIDWDVAIDHAKLKAKEDPAIKRYQAMKRKPQTEAQAQKNMMVYLKNDVGFKLDYFKGMSYDDIRLIFEAKCNSNVDFLLKTNEQMEEEENRAL
uniref:Xylulose kinase-1 n=1 Tax=Tanacetum cinerariifolium TaxID=118510 RepID=A0A699HID7_TANCI|nr:hypothetical protein [Tanacetum cinerariifolium]